MRDNPLNQFLESVISINATTPGSGESMAGFNAVRGPQLGLLEETKRKALAFAVEKHKSPPDPDRLNQLADDLEGGILGLNSYSLIDQKQLDKLLDGLHSLKNSSNGS